MPLESSQSAVRRKPGAERILDALNQRQCLSLTAEAFAALLDDAGALHQFILDSSPELLYLLDSEGRIRFINRRVETLLGFRHQELIGQHYEALVDESFHSLARHMFDERRTGRRAGQPVELKLLSRLGPDGQRTTHPRGVWMELRAEGIYVDPDERTAENYLGACGAIRDISERKALEAQGSPQLAVPLTTKEQLAGQGTVSNWTTEGDFNFRAFHDAVTGLPNRTLFDDRLSVAITQAKRSRRKLAVMFLDLNRFKRVNDRLGHSVGDRLLRAVAQRVRACLRQGDTLSRFGGDEFTLLVPSVRSRGAVERIAGKILDCFDAPFVIDGRRLRVGASIGIALTPEGGEQGDALIEAADIAMYHAKDQGGNGYRLYSEAMNRGVMRRLTTARELRKALSRREFAVYYQPQVSLATGEVCGVEALVRWRHPTRGLLKPDDFLLAAEDAGLLAEIDALVQQQAFTEAAHWRHNGAGDVRVSVNVSGAALEQDDFADKLPARLRKAGLEASAVRLEIDEYRLSQSRALVMPKLQALNELGVRIAADRFGAGYAALAYLQHSPVSQLNVDASIVHDIRADDRGRGIIKAIAAFAGALDVKLLAEGVSNRVQLRCLCAEGYDEAQGVLFSPPLPGSDLARVLNGEAFAGLVRQARLPAGT